MMQGRRARIGAVLIGTVLLGGCTHGEPSVVCIGVGGSSGVSFDYTQVLRQHRGEALVVEACVEDECQRLELGPTRRQRGGVVGAEVVDDSDPREATLTISTVGGEVVHDSRLTVHPVASGPARSVCEAPTWSAQVHASGTDTMEQIG